MVVEVFLVVVVVVVVVATVVVEVEVVAVAVRLDIIIGFIVLIDEIIVCLIASEVAAVVAGVYI